MVPGRRNCCQKGRPSAEPLWAATPKPPKPKPLSYRPKELPIMFLDVFLSILYTNSTVVEAPMLPQDLNPKILNL